MAEDVDSLFGRIVHPVAQSTLKSECGKLTDFTKIVHEFLQGISSVYDTVGTNINSLVEANKRKVTDLTKDSLQFQSTTIQAWNEMLDMWSEEAQAHITFAKDLKSETVNTLHEQRVHVKDSVKRIYSYRDALNGTAGKEASDTDKLQRDYSGNWLKHKQQVSSGTTRKGSIMPTYTAYNNYLLQLSYSNGAAKSLLDIQMPNLMQELEVIQLNLHNLILSVLTYSWERQAHHFTDCLERAHSGSEIVAKISPDTDVTNLGASITIPPDPIQTNKDFIPADTPDLLSEDLCNGYLAKEEYTSHTLGKRFKQVRHQLDKQDKTICKGNKDLIALAKLLSTYQENPTYGKSSEIEVQMSQLRHELRVLEMKQSGYSCQLGLLEESGVSVDSSGSMPSDSDFDDADRQSIASVNKTAEEGEHEWDTLSYTDIKTCDHCQRAIVLTKCHQCIKCKVNCHSNCRNKVFDCVGQPLVESTSSAAAKLKDSMVGNLGGLFKGRRNTTGTEVKRMSSAVDPAPETTIDRDGTIKDEWWTIQRGAGGPDFTGFSEGDEDGEEDGEGIYDTIDRPAIIQEIEEEEEGEYQAPEELHPSDSDSSGRAPSVIKQSDSRPPLPPPNLPDTGLTRPLPTVQPNTLTKHPPKPGAIYVSVALYAYSEQDSELYCEAGDRVDVYEEANQDWSKGECHGKTGYFPANYIEQVPSTGVVLRALYDYEANEPDEVSLIKGQVIFQIEDQHNGWLYGKVKGHRGIFPSSYVETLDEFL